MSSGATFEDRVRFMPHKGQPILLLDFSRCSAKEGLILLDIIRTTMAQQPAGSVLALADFTEAQIDKPAARRLQEVLVLDRPFVKRAAWVGTQSLPKVFYEHFKNFSQRELPTFDSREEAMDWLVRD